MSSPKAVHEVLGRIKSTVEFFKGTPDEISLPLQAISGDDWGYGIHCAKGVWVTECDPSIAPKVIEEFEKYMEELK